MYGTASKSIVSARALLTALARKNILGEVTDTLSSSGSDLVLAGRRELAANNPAKMFAFSTGSVNTSSFILSIGTELALFRNLLTNDQKRLPPAEKKDLSTKTLLV